MPNPGVLTSGIFVLKAAGLSLREGGELRAQPVPQALPQTQGFQKQCGNLRTRVPEATAERSAAAGPADILPVGGSWDWPALGGS